ncbi:YugN-like family protein [Paenibacillus sp. ACRRX]|uniref:YugN family protein n=1 Tax=unclassified Paenibacillus TaxID=185978 RepID=UPI001EF5FE70|nr:MULTISPECIES: YugN family protein [unclassified Paenibacillus]MCG7407623.1 YugN-like family protein [Paenibacillus sp. ACRRX]MDK8180858.1 YugN family protein [Paenibacillus sp. UMB4589-SE434]
MIIENSGLNGIVSELAHLDEVSESLGFVRWQWEYYRATYDLKLEDTQNGAEYFVRVNTRVTEGKLEKPDTLLAIEAVYMGKATFPHGLDYESPIPQAIVNAATQKLEQFKQALIA